MEKKAQIDGIVGMITSLAIGMIVIFLFLAVMLPTSFNRADDLKESLTDNGTLTTTSATDFSGVECVAGSETCTNYTGGVAGTALNAGNITWTDSTCSILLVGATWNNTNIQCSYTGGGASYGNLSSGLENLTEETKDLIPIAFAIIILIMLFAAVAIYNKSKN